MNANVVKSLKCVIIETTHKNDKNVMPKKKPEHYVNNKELLESLIVYRSKVEEIL